MEWARVTLIFSLFVYAVFHGLNFALLWCSFIVGKFILLQQGERGRYRDGSRAMANTRPTKTLFVINFDPIHTRIRDIERHFEPYGKVLHVRIRRNFAFVQFEMQEDATRALECTHMRLVAINLCISGGFWDVTLLRSSGSMVFFFLMINLSLLLKKKGENPFVE